MADVKALLSSYAAKRGISVKEVEQLRSTVLADGPQKVGVDMKEFKALKQGLVAHSDDFSSPAAKAKYERLIGAFAVSGGKVVQKYAEFNDLWKIENNANFRAKWGISDKNDPKAPTYTQETKLSSVPAAIRTKFEAYASKVLKNEINLRRSWGGDEANFKLELTGAHRIFDRNHNPIGYAVRTNVSGFTGYYRKDGTPAGVSGDPPTS